MDIEPQNQSNILFKPKPYTEPVADVNMNVDKNILNQTGSILNRSSMMTYGKM